MAIFLKSYHFFGSSRHNLVEKLKTFKSFHLEKANKTPSNESGEFILKSQPMSTSVYYWEPCTARTLPCSILKGWFALLFLKLPDILNKLLKKKQENIRKYTFDGIRLLQQMFLWAIRCINLKKKHKVFQQKILHLLFSALV